MDTPADVLEYYLKANAPAKEDGGKYDSVNDYKDELMSEFLTKNPSIFKDGKIGDNAKLEKLDFPSTEQLKAYLKDTEDTPPTHQRATKEEAIQIGQEIFAIADEYSSDNSARLIYGYIKDNINENNIVEVWNYYLESQKGNGHLNNDRSIIDTITSEWLHSGAENGRDYAVRACKHMFNAIKIRASQISPQPDNLKQALLKLDQAMEIIDNSNYINGKGMDGSLDGTLSSPMDAVVKAIIEAEKAE